VHMIENLSNTIGGTMQLSAALIDLSCHWLGVWYCARVKLPFLTTLVMPI
jgi:hypothetical protein